MKIITEPDYRPCKLLSIAYGLIGCILGILNNLGFIHSGFASGEMVIVLMISSYMIFWGAS